MVDTLETRDMRMKWQAFLKEHPIMKTEIVIDPISRKADYQTIQAGIAHLSSLPNYVKDHDH